MNLKKITDSTLGRFVTGLSDEMGVSQPSRLAAAMAYYGMFSFAPAIFVTIAVASIFIGQLAASGQLFNQLARVVGPDTARFVYDLVVNVSVSASEGNPLITLISVLALLYAASGLFVNLKYSLNTIWDVPLATYSGIIGFIKTRLLAFVMVISLGLLLVLTTFGSLVVAVLDSFFKWGGFVPTVNFFTSVVLLAVSLLLVYKIVPDTRIAWRDVWLGAVLTALLIRVGAALVGIYLSLSNFGSAFEAAGALAVLLLAIYYLAMIFLFGAIFTKVYASMFGSRATPEMEER
jgi:membrane protein